MKRIRTIDVELIKNGHGYRLVVHANFEKVAFMTIDPDAVQSKITLEIEPGMTDEQIISAFYERMPPSGPPENRKERPLEGDAPENP